MRELIRKGVSLIFVNADTEAAVNLAPEFPKVQFCQISMPTIPIEGQPDNYHTFNGEIYQARYTAGIVAGMKLRELIDSGAILPENAIVGYVAANNSAEVVSGFTAFLLGVRNVAPEAVMKVKYTNSWSNYPKEKETAQELIDAGCVVLSHHTNTMAPAIACEDAFSKGNRVYFVGYHQSMMDVAPSCALLSIRTNWMPYIQQAVDAVWQKQDIEKVVKGNLHGNDISAGFEEDWVQMLELNKHAVPQGTEERMNRAVASLQKGKTAVFSGKYTGVNPDDPSDTVDLSRGYEECRDSSSPSFRYILQNIIIEDNPEINEAQ
jgi:basic membrane protein A